MLLLLIISLLLVPQLETKEDTLLMQQAKDQAQEYVEQINAGYEVDLHIWGLATLCQNRQHPQIIEFINTKISTDKQLQTLDAPFCNDQSLSQNLADLAFKLESPELLLAAIIDESNRQTKRQLYTDYSRQIGFQKNSSLNFSNIISTILEKREIDTDILPLEPFTFTHFLLFFNSDLRREKIITTHYFKQTVDAWNLSEHSFKKPSLKNSIYLFSFFQALYRTNSYSLINPLYTDLISDKFFPISISRMNVYRYLDYSMNVLGYWDRSLEVSRNFSVRLARFLNAKEKELYSLYLQGVYLDKIGKIKEAQKINLFVLEEAKKYNGNSIQRSSLLNNLALTYVKSGEFDKFLEHQFQALNLAKKQNNYAHQLQILLNLYIFEKGNQDRESALRYLRQYEDLAKQQTDTELLGQIYTYLGGYYRDLEQNYKTSKFYYKKADSTLNSDLHYFTFLNLQFEQAELKQNLNQFTEALKIYRKIENLAQEKKDQKNYLDAIVRESEILLRNGEYQQVSNKINLVDKESLALLNFKVAVLAQKVKADYLIQTGQKQEAYQILHSTVDQIINWTQNSTDLQSGFWNVEDAYLDAIQLYVDLLIDMNRPGEALLALDQLKTINDAGLLQNPMVKSTQLNEAELTQYQRLTNQLNQLRKQQLSASDQKKFEIQSQIDRFSAQKRALDRKVTRLADREPITFRQVQQQLTGRDVALHITELNDLYYVATITRRSIDFKKINLDKYKRSLFEQTIKELAQGETDLNKLYRIGTLLGLSELPPYTDNIILIPDSYLYQLPFDVIPLSAPSQNYSYGEPTYLIERYKTEYVTSLDELRPVDAGQKKFAWDYVGFGISDFTTEKDSLIPLPYASYEVSQISRELSNLTNHKTLLNKNSTKEAFRTFAPNSRIIHLATHSKVSEQDPLFSTIYMSSEEDSASSRIFAYELFEMNLNNDLIMLNSCESGSGSYLQGSGIVGISRALRYAGAESLVLNLWSVNDMMASDFAVRFYQALNSGESKSEALRTAKLHFLKHKNANPHYWGTYMLLGNDRPVVQPYRIANFMFATGFMVYLITLVSITYVIQAKRNGGTNS